MKYQVVHDAQGNIISAAELQYADETFKSAPVPGPNQYVAEVDVPDEHAEAGLMDLHQRLKVITGGQQPRLTPKQ